MTDRLIMPAHVARRGLRLPFLALVALAAGCASVECDPERLPHRGRAGTPEALAEIVNHAAANECWRTLYDLTTAATHEAHSFPKFRLGIPSLRLPPDLGGARVVDLLRDGRLVGTLATPDVRSDELLGILAYPPGRSTERLFSILLVPEVPEGHCPHVTPPEWRLGLEEQGRRGVPWTMDEPRAPERPK